VIDIILKGIYAGAISGIIAGICTLISDGIFYSKYVKSSEMARVFSKPLMQLVLFMLISIVYGSIQGGILAWLLPILPEGWLIRGIIFGVISYLILSRHFIEGFAFMNPKYMPTNLTIYLSVEFLMIYILQGIIASKIMDAWLT
jgi:hypothetical protein